MWNKKAWERTDKILKFKRKKLTHKELLQNQEAEVYSEPLFKKHIKEVAALLELDEQIVDDVIKGWLSIILEIMSKEPRFYTRIYLISSFIIEVYTGRPSRKSKEDIINNKSNPKKKNDEQSKSNG